MKVTIKVELDDGQELNWFSEVDSAGNPKFWSQGFIVAAEASVEAVKKMVEAQYGTADYQGVHIIK